MVSIPQHARFGFPNQDNPTVSHWLQTVKGDPLLDHRTTSDLPETADIVIIGSGITGTLVAKHSVEAWPGKSVVVLEARQFCSGATGRNAGHCKPDQWRGFAKYEEAFGTQEAIKILENEQQTWSNLVSYVRKNNVDCELWVGDTLDVPITPEAAQIAHNTFERFKAAGGRVNHIKVINDPTTAAEKTRIRDAQACYAWPASTLHPWKLAAHVMRDNLTNGVNLQTHSPVSSVTESSKTAGKWVVHTERGSIECSQVVHATNAYSSALEPLLRGLISPIPHICNKITPPANFQGDARLSGSYGVLAPEEGLITINPRRDVGDPVLFGGRNPGQSELVEWLDQHPERCIDDGLAGFTPIVEAVQQFVSAQFNDWGSSEPRESYSWSGIIGLSSDGVPYIGELPGKPGQWVCAGHNGHGMARIFTAAPALVKLIGGSSWEETQLPEVFRITPSRIERVKSRLSQ